MAPETPSGGAPQSLTEPTRIISCKCQNVLGNMIMHKCPTAAYFKSQGKLDTKHPSPSLLLTISHEVLSAANNPPCNPPCFSSAVADFVQHVSTVKKETSDQNQTSTVILYRKGTKGPLIKRKNPVQGQPLVCKPSAHLGSEWEIIGWRDIRYDWPTYMCCNCVQTQRGEGLKYPLKEGITVY